MLTRYFLQCEAKDNRPEQDTDVVGIDNRKNGIGNHIVNLVGKHVVQSARCLCFNHIFEHKHDREHETDNHCRQRRNEGAEHILAHHNPKAWSQCPLALEIEEMTRMATRTGAMAFSKLTKI